MLSPTRSPRAVGLELCNTPPVSRTEGVMRQIEAMRWRTVFPKHRGDDVPGFSKPVPKGRINNALAQSLKPRLPRRHFVRYPE